LAQSSALLCRDHEGARGAALAAADHPSLVKFAPGTAAVGFTTAALLEIERAGSHEVLALEVAQGASSGLIGAPKLLAKLLQIIGHLHMLYIYACRLQAQNEATNGKV
jgi:hypothetical protein